MDAAKQESINAASSEGAPCPDRVAATRGEICALLGRLHEKLDELGREVTVFDGLVLRQGDLFKQAGMD